MKIAVVTPYYKETDEVLTQCHQSVVDQIVRCDHYLVADGFPNPIVDTWDVKRIDLADAHADCGNTPRVLGSLSAFNSGYDAVAFLDADNWFRPDHIGRMAELHRRSGADVCVSNRSMWRPDGSYMFDDDKNDGRRHVDTSCLFMTRSIFSVLARWAAMPKQLGPVCDTVYWETIKEAGLSVAHDPTPTVCFRTTYESDFRRLGEPFPSGVKSVASTDAPFDWIASQPPAARRRIRRELGWPLSIRSRLSRRLGTFGQGLATSGA